MFARCEESVERCPSSSGQSTAGSRSRQCATKSSITGQVQLAASPPSRSAGSWTNRTGSNAGPDGLPNSRLGTGLIS